jgi:hypothetical protein
VLKLSSICQDIVVVSNLLESFFGQENIKILHWNNETFRDESLKGQQLVGVNQAGISVFPNLS